MFKINELTIGGSECVIVAEAGVNHLKRLDYAEEIVRSAARAGANIVKFQTYHADRLTTKKAPRYWQWSGEPVKNGSQHDTYSKLATPELDFTRGLKDLCDRYGVLFMSTPFDEQSALMLDSIGCSAYKIASGDITNFPLLRSVAALGKPMFLSTGASSITEIKDAIDTIEHVKRVPLVIMHCILCYPTRVVDVNLGAILDLRSKFASYVIGFSDHTVGPLIPSASVLYGCKVIEKHYTFDKSLPGSADHWLSVNEAELKVLVDQVRVLEKSVGTGVKCLEKCEEITRVNARRSLVASRPIKAGEKFSLDNLTAKRPAEGVSPIYIDDIIGLTAACDILDDEIIKPHHVVEDARFKPITPELLEKVKYP